mgnify:CR=1 FL=1
MTLGSHCRKLWCIVLTFFLFNPLVNASEAKDFFKIWPYTLRTDKGEVLLKFKLNKSYKFLVTGRIVIFISHSIY